MANVTFKALSDGPYDIPGGAKLLDQQRQEYAESARSIRSTFAAAARRRTNLSATAALRKSGSRRKRREVAGSLIKFQHSVLHHSDGARILAYWSAGMLEGLRKKKTGLTQH